MLIGVEKALSYIQINTVVSDPTPLQKKKSNAETADTISSLFKIKSTTHMSRVSTTWSVGESFTLELGDESIHIPCAGFQSPQSKFTYYKKTLKNPNQNTNPKPLQCTN